jgi:hypothetical protein
MITLVFRVHQAHETGTEKIENILGYLPLPGAPSLSTFVFGLKKILCSIDRIKGDPIVLVKKLPKVKHDPCFDKKCTYVYIFNGFCDKSTYITNWASYLGMLNFQLP